MVLKPGEKIHVVERRVLESDARRHTVGEVDAVEGTLVRMRAYVFVFDGSTNRFVRKPERRTRVVALDSRMTVNVMPSGVELDQLRYAQNAQGNLVVTDGAGFELDINEYSPLQ